MHACCIMHLRARHTYRHHVDGIGRHCDVARVSVHQALVRQPAMKQQQDSGALPDLLTSVDAMHRTMESMRSAGDPERQGEVNMQR